MGRAELPKLTDLCVRNLINNIVRHSQKLEATCEDPASYVTYVLYKVAQSCYADKFLQELERNHLNRNDAENGNGHHLNQLLSFLFLGKEISDFDVGPSLKFLFSEHTYRVERKGRDNLDVQHFFLRALTACKNLANLTLRWVTLHEAITGRLPSYRKLVTVDLIHCRITNTMIQDLLFNCSRLTILRASGTLINDMCLLSLCKNHPYSDSFTFCRNSENCCEFGKRLVELTLYNTKATQNGIASALQHLPSLKKLLEGSFELIDSGLYFLPRAVRLLSEACVSTGQPKPRLKLTIMMLNMFFDAYNPVTRECCPDVITFIKYFGPLKTLVKKECQQEKLMAMSIEELATISLLNGVIDILQSSYASRQFIIIGPLIIVEDSDYNGYVLEPPSDVRTLEAIHLPSLYTSCASALWFCAAMLTLAKNVKSLSLHGEIAEEALFHAMKTNYFCKLEEICIHNADLEKICFESFIKNNRALKKITHSSCRNVLAFTEKHKKLARECNFQLDIEHDESEVCTLVLPYLL